MVEYAEIKLRWSVRVKGNKGYKKQKKIFSFELADEIPTEKLRSFFDGAGNVNLRACSVSRRARIAPSDFSSDEEKLLKLYCRIARQFLEI